MEQTDTDLAAREALRARQGSGARYDAANAPADELLLARRGAAFFARKLNELTDTDLEAPSLREGRTRAYVIAEVSYQARMMAIALKSLREELTAEEAGWVPDIGLAATLPTRALRHLYAHADVHLNVEFRDLQPPHWEQEVAIGEGRPAPVRSVPLLRARTIWRSAIDLGTGARMADMPPVLL